MEELKLPANEKLAGKLVEGHVRNEQAKVDRGTLGILFGSRNSIPANVAAIISIVSALVLIFSVLKWSGSEGFTHKDGMTALSGLISLTLGYLFGRASKE